MSKLRSLNTSIWNDVWFEDLNVERKLLFVYLITNEKTNMLGIYEISSKKISFDTGISKDNVLKHLLYFEKTGKIKYIDDRIILLNYLKHQNYNFNMKKSAIDIYNDLPNCLKMSVNDNLSRDEKGFETLCKGFGMVRKVEVEYEEETEFKLEEETEKGKKGGVPIELHFPFESEKFLEQWNIWKDYKLAEFKFKYKSIHSEQGALIELNNLSNQNEEIAIAIIQQSINKTWKGFFELKNTTNGKQNTNNSGGKYSDDFMRKIAEGLQP